MQFLKLLHFYAQLCEWFFVLRVVSLVHEIELKANYNIVLRKMYETLEGYFNYCKPTQHDCMVLWMLIKFC